MTEKIYSTKKMSADEYFEVDGMKKLLVRSGNDLYINVEGNQYRLFQEGFFHEKGVQN
jgi:hypothetical protein